MSTILGQKSTFSGQIHMDSQEVMRGVKILGSV